MDSFSVIHLYLQKKSNLADSAPGFVDGGIAPSLYYIETLPHGSYSNTSTGMDFTRLQNDLIERKKSKKRKKKKNGV